MSVPTMTRGQSQEPADTLERTAFSTSRQLDFVSRAGVDASVRLRAARGVIERDYGTLLDGAGAGIASRLAAFEVEQDQATGDAEGSL